MPTLDVFTGNAFNTISLTQAINKLPYKATRIKQLGLFAPKGVTTRSIMVEEKAGVLRILESQPWGGPPQLNVPVKRTVRSFSIPHFPLADSVMASDVQGIRPFGQETGEESVASKVNEKLAEMKQNHEITQEYLMAGALQGLMVDGAGTTIYNLFTQFAVSEQSVDLLLGTTATVKEKVLDIKRAVETALGAIPFDHVHCLCGKTLFNSFIQNDAVEAAFARYLDGQFLRTDQRRGFEFCGVTFEEYPGQVGSSTFLPATEFRAFPVGAPGVFQMNYAPADYIETVNTVGQPYYAKQRLMDFDKGIEIETQSNPLPMCMIPAACVKATSST
jgi:hypothetical protein